MRECLTATSSTDNNGGFTVAAAPKARSQFTGMSCMLGVLIASTAANATAQSTTVHSLTVRRFTAVAQQGQSVAFTDQNALDAFAAANAISADDDGNGTVDIACDHSMTLSGTVGQFSIWGSDGVVDSSGEFQVIQGSTDGFVKVVSAINWCGKTQPGILGCATTGGENGILATRNASLGNLRGIVWAHEFGHSAGLSHRSGATLLMNPSGDADNTMMNSAECTTMKNDHIDLDGPEGNPAPLTASPISSEPTSFEVVPIRDLARSGFVDSLPFEAADHYNDDDVVVLIEMLEDDLEKEHHATIAALIGILSNGLDRDARALADFADTDDDVAAVSSAVTSLGYVANRGSIVALDVLIGKSEKSDSPAAEWAVSGLGVSGKPRALQQLQKLRRDADAPGRASGRFGRASQHLDDALATHKEIAAKGIRGFYGR